MKTAAAVFITAFKAPDNDPALFAVISFVTADPAVTVFQLFSAIGADGGLAADTLFRSGWSPYHLIMMDQSHF